MQKFLARRYRRGTCVLVVCLGVLAGLGFARVSGDGQLWLCWGMALPLLAVWRKQNMALLVLLLVFGATIGWWRGSVYLRTLGAYEPLYLHATTLSVQASEDAVYGKTKQMSFTADHITLPSGRVLTGKIQVSGFGANAIFQGDELRVTGKLYPGYGAYQGRLSFALINVVQHHTTLVATIRRNFVAGTQSALPEPLAPFVMGLLVGQRATLPQDVKDDLQKVGLTHIIAVSGYNLTIILQASRRVLGKRSKRLSTFLSLVLIAVFLLLAGASASIVRAAIVSMVSIATAYYGRSFQPLSLICFAAAITAYADPVYIWSDLSWYLSFLAFFGVMIVSPLMQARWPGKWHQNIVGAVALESVCAEMMSLPFVLYIFGQMSLVGLPANILVVTMVPLAMLLGVVAGLAGMLAPAIAGWFSWPAKELLNYMLDTAHIIAHLPHIFIENRSLPLQYMLALYLLIALFCLSLRHKTKHAKPAIITDIKEPMYRGLLA